MIYDHDVTACVGVEAERHVVTAESVAMVVEVKSTLDASTDVATELARLDALGMLRRFYRLTPLLAASHGHHPQREEIDAFLRDGIGAREANGRATEASGSNVNGIAIGYFGFTGWKDPARAAAFATATNADIVCVLDGATVMRRLDGELTPVDDSDAALAVFLTYVRGVLQAHRDTRSVVTPDAWRYLDEVHI